MLRHRSQLLLSSLLLTSMVLAACSPKKNSSADNSPHEIIFVKGNPDNIFAGANLKSQSPLTETNITDLKDYALLQVFEFTEREKVDTTAQRNIEKENTSNDQTKHQLEEDLLAIHVDKIQNDQWDIGLLRGNLILHLKKDAANRLQIVGATQTKTNESVEISALHWSQSKDGRYMSFLGRADDPESGRQIFAIYFERAKPAKTLERTNPEYVYGLGPGIKLSWQVAANEGVQVDFCSTDSTFQSMAKESTQQWTNALSNRLKIKFSKPGSYAPFTDLNQHCIYIVDAYLTESNHNIGNYGATYSIRSQRNNEIADADVFIFKSELEKIADAAYGRSDAAEIYNRHASISFTHELGHLFGLGHKFDGTNSIMSYKFSTTTLTTYDVSAIQELYPVRPEIRN